MNKPTKIIAHYDASQIRYDSNKSIVLKELTELCNTDILIRLQIDGISSDILGEQTIEVVDPRVKGVNNPYLYEREWVRVVVTRKLKRDE